MEATRSEDSYKHRLWSRQPRPGAPTQPEEGLCTSASASIKGAAGASGAPDTRARASGIWHIPGSEKVPVSLGHKAPHPLGRHHHSRTYADPAQHAGRLVRALGRGCHGSQVSLISGGLREEPVWPLGQQEENRPARSLGSWRLAENPRAGAGALL